MNRKMYATFFAGFAAGVLAMVFLADVFVNGPSWLKMSRAAPPAPKKKVEAKTEEPEYGLIVPLADLDVKARIAGRLGHPLGRIITIRGEWIEPIDPRKDFNDLPIFRVEWVNGKFLEEYVEFPRSAIRGFSDGEEHLPAAGEVWEMRGTEIGGYVGLPSELYIDASRDPAAKQNKTPYEFRTHFFFSRVRLLYE